MPAKPVIALISDFGFDDPFVGIMKAVISNISPQTNIIDINHSIPQGEIQRAALQLWMAKSYFPPGTIFMIVVDPGVGTPREAILLEDEHFTYIGPNNGLFSYVVDQDSAAWELSNPNYQLANSSRTFHGRDIFAPAAAHAANGVAGVQFGDQIHEVFHLPVPELQVNSARISGEIIYSDHFGNLLTSLGKFVKSGDKQYKFEPWLQIDAVSTREIQFQIDRAALLLPGGQSLSWVETFADIATGECGILVGSTGLIEIAAFNNSAQVLTDLSLGDPVTLLF